MERHVQESILGNVNQELLELMADYLDSDTLKLNEAIAQVSDPINFSKSELHIRMAKAAFCEYLNTVLPMHP